MGRAEIDRIVEDLKGRLPSFESAPLQERTADGKSVVGVVRINDGKFAKCTIILHSIELAGSDVKIDYTAHDADANMISDASVGELVGDIVNYFLALEAQKKS